MTVLRWPASHSGNRGEPIARRRFVDANQHGRSDHRVVLPTLFPAACPRGTGLDSPVSRLIDDWHAVTLDQTEIIFQ